MKCNNCGSSWVVSEEMKMRIFECPFCRTILKSDIEEQSIEKELKKWIGLEGNDLLKNTQKINGILADVFPKNKKERKIIKYALDTGIGYLFYDIAVDKKGELPIVKINQIRSVLDEEACLTAEAIEYIVFVFGYAIGLKVESENNMFHDNEIKENNETSNSIRISSIADGIEYEKSGNYQEALEIYKFYEDNAEVCYRIAEIMYNIKADKAKAFKYYLRAAEMGYSLAQNALGYMYEHGDGIQKDKKNALEWYLKAAENGYYIAQHNAGFMYYMGDGVEKDYRKAFELFLKAATYGHSGSQNNLGVMYEYGQGIQRDRNKALTWYEKAFYNGNDDGKDNYERLLKN